MLAVRVRIEDARSERLKSRILALPTARTRLGAEGMALVIARYLGVVAGY